MRYVDCDINAGNFIDSYRNIGYSIETAITDIIDNSISAKAYEIHVDMEWDPEDESSKPFVRIRDNGVGMNDQELYEAMRLASRSPLDYREPDDLGRFGLGLKAASFSQCRRLTVISRKKGFSVSCKQWDIDHIKEEGAFELTDCTPEEVGLSDSVPQNNGTVVIWQNLDQLNVPAELEANKKEKLWISILDRVYRHIQVTYGDLGKQISFYFNDNTVELWNPFDFKNVVISTDEKIPLGSSFVRIRTYILPKSMTPEEQMRASLNKSMNDMQGFYIYRNNRLIKYGGWLGLPKMTNKEAYRLARIRLDIDNSMDEYWHIDVKKENAVCPPAIVDKLISYAKQARADSRKIFRSKGRTLRRNSNNDKATFLWSYGMKNDKPYYEINRENPLIKMFIESLDDRQKKNFSIMIRAVEDYIPVMSILETESVSNGEYIDNPASVITDEEIAQSFKDMVESLVTYDGLNLNEAIVFLRSTEPFSSHLEIVDEVSERLKKGI